MPLVEGLWTLLSALVLKNTWIVANKYWFSICANAFHRLPLCCRFFPWLSSLPSNVLVFSLPVAPSSSGPSWAPGQARPRRLNPPPSKATSQEGSTERSAFASFCFFNLLLYKHIQSHRHWPITQCVHYLASTIINISSLLLSLTSAWSKCHVYFNIYI